MKKRMKCEATKKVADPIKVAVKIYKKYHREVSLWDEGNIAGLSEVREVAREIRKSKTKKEKK